jgi:hypothetical protein
MGISARNISGMTLHAALCMKQGSRSYQSNKNQCELMGMWEGVDYLFIDEVSMIGSCFMCQISEALSNAKGNTSAFGGINIIFAGDFAQLAPVGDDHLYAQLNARTIAHCGTTTDQQTIFWKLLWYSIKTIVILNLIEQQSGPKNKEFVDLLGHMQEGHCSAADFALLNKHMIGNSSENLHEPQWIQVPIQYDTTFNTKKMNVTHQINETQMWLLSSGYKIQTKLLVKINTKVTSTHHSTL